MKKQMEQVTHWHATLEHELEKDYMSALLSFLEQEEKVNTVFPSKGERLMALNATPFHAIKVVILGQDPYHGEGQAHGLSFSVKPDVKIPPSLVNIYKELEADLAISPANHGSLLRWAEQGVLLLNSVLTVSEGKAGSHQRKGWETFTDRIIELINEEHVGVVFMLWGSYAQKKGGQIDKEKHCVLESVHPSPLSAYRGFFGCGHFSKANQYLLSQNKTPIHWSLGSVDQQALAEETHQVSLPF